jgi:hypothetical protein
MSFKLHREPRCVNAEDDYCVWSVSVNGYIVGTWYGGKEKPWKNPLAWARRQTKKRVLVLNKNIKRVELELEELKTEYNALVESEFFNMKGGA